MKHTWIAFLVIALGARVMPAVADSVPKLNVGPSCEAASREGISSGRNKQACLDDEGEARDQLAKSWSQYSTRNKNDCGTLASKGGPSSYVELITCLDVLKGAAAIGKAKPLAQPSDQNSKGTSRNAGTIRSRTRIVHAPTSAQTTIP